MSDTNFVAGQVIPLNWIQDVNNVVYRGCGAAITPATLAAFIGALTNPMTAAGDVIVGGSAGVATRLAIGGSGQVLTVVGGVPQWAAASSGFTNPMTAPGDLITGGASGAAGRLGVGTAGQVLTVVSGAPAWAAAGGYTPPPLPVKAQTGTSYTLALTDAPVANASQGIVTMNNAAANTLTVPPNSSVAFPVGAQVQVVQLGAGQTTIAAGAGVTISNPSSLTARARYSTLVLTQVAANVWVLGGDMT